MGRVFTPQCGDDCGESQLLGHVAQLAFLLARARSRSRLSAASEAAVGLTTVPAVLCVSRTAPSSARAPVPWEQPVSPARLAAPGSCGQRSPSPSGTAAAPMPPVSRIAPYLSWLRSLRTVSSGPSHAVMGGRCSFFLVADYDSSCAHVSKTGSQSATCIPCSGVPCSTARRTRPEWGTTSGPAGG